MGFSGGVLINFAVLLALWAGNVIKLPRAANVYLS
jgi:hypothetical protein